VEVLVEVMDMLVVEGVAVEVVVGERWLDKHFLPNL
tara:strand:- start:368 stop:475 length:108 start_codon:yes stop_codon:yes gene_type:complete